MELSSVRSRRCSCVCSLPQTAGGRSRVSGEEGNRSTLHLHTQGRAAVPTRGACCHIWLQPDRRSQGHGMGLSGTRSLPLPIAGSRPWEVWSEQSHSPQVLPSQKNLLLRLNKRNHVNEYLLLSNPLSTSKWRYTALFLITLLRCFMEYQMKIQLSLKFKKLSIFSFAPIIYAIAERNQRMEGCFACSLWSKNHYLSSSFSPSLHIHMSTAHTHMM